MTPPLTPREVETLAAYCRLGSYKAVAFRLGISPRTVKQHLAVVRGKLGADTSARAGMIAVRRGILTWRDVTPAA